VIIDPFGHRWMLLRPPPAATRFRQGDVAHVTMLTRDADRAKDFYETVLAVPFAAGHPGAWRSDAITPPVGIISAKDHADPQVQLSFRVDDLTAAIERVLTAGGRADQPRRMPYGLLAECVDDQGVIFRLWQPA
jgi:predicted enzyme related to lactoylglutathione lyase